MLSKELSVSGHSAFLTFLCSSFKSVRRMGSELREKRLFKEESEPKRPAKVKPRLVLPSLSGHFSCNQIRPAFCKTLETQELRRHLRFPCTCTSCRPEVDPFRAEQHRAVFKKRVPQGKLGCEENQTEEITPSSPTAAFWLRRLETDHSCDIYVAVSLWPHTKSVTTANLRPFTGKQSEMLRKPENGVTASISRS